MPELQCAHGLPLIGQWLKEMAYIIDVLKNGGGVVRHGDGGVEIPVRPLRYRQNLQSKPYERKGNGKMIQR